MLWLVGSNPVLRQRRRRRSRRPTGCSTNTSRTTPKTGDANDILYALEASRDYDPGPGLEKITAPLLAINSADDIINPPELQILEREIKRVPKGRAIVLPLSDRTTGHGTHTQAAVWKQLSGGTAPGDRTMTFSLGPYFSLRDPDQISLSARDNARTAWPAFEDTS